MMFPKRKLKFRDNFLEKDKLRKESIAEDPCEFLWIGQEGCANLDTRIHQCKRKKNHLPPHKCSCGSKKK